MEETNREFYIGWQPHAPRSIMVRMRQAVIALLVIAPVIGGIVVLHQIGFATSRFEYGISTSVEGRLMTSPAPFIRIFRGVDIGRDSVFQHILLVGPGKHGVAEMLESVQQALGYSLEGRNLSVSGFLIYHDGKTLMEVEDMKDIAETGPPYRTGTPGVRGKGIIIGEITDPKCLFGVMKPGYGKPHRSCAARCIAGGIPPVLKTNSTTGEVQYYVLEGGSKGELNQQVLPFVGDQVAVCGEVYQLGEWLVLRKDPDRKIELFQRGPGQAMSMCN